MFERKNNKREKKWEQRKKEIQKQLNKKEERQ